MSSAITNYKEYSTLNAGKYNKKIKIYSIITTKDEHNFMVKQKTLVLQPYASVKTTKGFTLIANDSDFEKALTRFTIRYPKTIAINRDMIIEFNNKEYSIQYINNIDEENKELELQCKEVTH